MTINWRKNLTALTLIVVLAASFLATRSSTKKPDINYSVFNGRKGWGYNILLNNSVVIHQDVIPAMQVQSGFRTREGARSAAELVISKLKTNQNPVLTGSEVEKIQLSQK